MAGAMIVLALDTALQAAQVALLDGATGKVRAQRSVPMQTGHAEALIPLVEAAMAEAGLRMRDIGRIGAAIGPGSFTGVRIGIGIAQGLALGANLPMIGVSTLATMAQGAFRKTGATRVLAAIDARMGEVYWAEYQRDEQGEWQGAESEAVLKPEAAQARIAQLSGEWATVGTGWQAYPQLLAGTTGAQLLTTTVTLPAAEDMLPLALSAWQRGDSVAVENAEPVYLRNEVAWKKLPGR